MLFEYLVTDVAECLVAIDNKRKSNPLPTG